jgi:hypothetical protein
MARNQKKKHEREKIDQSQHWDSNFDGCNLSNESLSLR